MKFWNFRKGDWKHFCFFTRKSVWRLPPPDTTNIDKAYQELCESLLFAAERCIPLSHRKNYVPCWDKECEALYCSFLRAPVGTASDRAASSLLSQLDDKKQERWEETVNSIDFSHSSRKAWSSHQQTLKKTSTPIVKFKWTQSSDESLAYHPFHNVHREPVDEIFLSSLIQPKDNTAIQYLYLWFFNHTPEHSHLPLRLQCVFRSYDSHFAFIVKHGVGTGGCSCLRAVFIKMCLDWCNPIAPACRWDWCHAHDCSQTLQPFSSLPWSIPTWIKE